MGTIGQVTVDLGAFRTQVGVVDQCPVAVLQACPAVAAFTGHDPFIALEADEFGLPRAEDLQC